MKGVPHTIKVERVGKELVVHLALLDEHHAKLPGGIILASEGWIDIGYGLKMFLAIGHANVHFRPMQLQVEQKRSFLPRLFGRKSQPQPLLEAKP